MNSTELKRTISFCLFVVVILCAKVSVWADEFSQCPSISVEVSAEIVEGEPVTFTANISNANPAATLSFRWSISAGAITSGQNTNTITVNTAGLGRQPITGSVEVIGLSETCPNTASGTTPIIDVFCGRSLDEYGDLTFGDEKARLDNLVAEMQNNPAAQGYIIAYGGRRGRASEARRRADRAKEYIVNQRGIEADRIVIIDGGFREEMTIVLYIVPAGAVPPTAAPTVDANEVEVIPLSRAFNYRLH